MIYGTPYKEISYQLRLGSPYTMSEALAQRDDPATAGCAAELLGRLVARAEAGSAMKQEDIYATSFDRGLSIHLYRYGGCAAFYTYEAGNGDGMRILGFCHSQAVNSFFPNIVPRLQYVP